jgi:hypothetical protein
MENIKERCVRHTEFGRQLRSESGRVGQSSLTRAASRNPRGGSVGCLNQRPWAGAWQPWPPLPILDTAAEVTVTLFNSKWSIQNSDSEIAASRSGHFWDTINYIPQEYSWHKGDSVFHAETGITLDSASQSIFVCFLIVLFWEHSFSTDFLFYTTSILDLLYLLLPSNMFLVSSFQAFQPNIYVLSFLRYCYSTVLFYFLFSIVVYCHQFSSPSISFCVTAHSANLNLFIICSV